ncbi:hypothetical protein ETAA8_06470 [Anatilimnocola aggregata]|uniref:Transposase IS200-like domain-containing protein n=1 Tax=Anatilimnocola aggregata TaxID=2528021 RepID=A0A517Y5R0_9BACT|nr:transposase [Anatilimnocola aggregata]QDU25578.1 hypothetical protein ETAA8_06470 [Anatilimnocola aggregata]
MTVVRSQTDPLAFFFTWATYGTWLPGDQRGWVEFRHGFQLPDPWRELESMAKMTEGSCRLSPPEREQVHDQLRETCHFKQWQLHAVNCRSNHLHAVISASAAPRLMRTQIKAWLTRRLKSFCATNRRESREHWWAERGSIRWLFEDDHLEAAILYVRDGQDRPRPK